MSDPGLLLRHLNLPADTCPRPGPALREFPLRVPRGFITRISAGDPDDPLLRQVLPAAVEDEPQAGYARDPLNESGTMPVPGLLHKYQGRVLLITTGMCAIHCRYCFRRHFPYPGNHAARGDWEPALQYIRGDPTICEVILSGGDPLSLADGKLALLAQHLAAIPHLKRLRLHTRMPVVMPSRVTAELAGWLTGTRLRPVVVIHCNHPNEVDTAAGSALQRLVAASIPVLNQAVLLRGVNDSAPILAALGEKLLDFGVLPYYLHLLDPVAGAARFEVQAGTALEILDQLRRTQPGYLVPRLVREVPGAPGKIPLL